MTTPTPEAIEAGVTSGMDTHDWELLQTQGDIGEAVEMAIRDALSAAYPLMVAQAKAEALREAADAWWMEANPGAKFDAWKWMKDRAATIESESA